MGTQVRISVDSAREPGTADAATRVLHRRLAPFAADGEEWRGLRTEPRPGGPPAQGPVTDVVLEFAGGQLAPALVGAAAARLVRAVVAHFRTQTDSSQTATVRIGEHSVELRATGMTPEEISALELRIAGWLSGRSED